MEIKFILSILFGIGAYLFLNVGMGIQKWKAPVLKKYLKIFKNWVDIKDFLIWVGGSLLTTVAMALLFQALALGDASIIAALAGLGVVFLSLFSYFFLKEPISKIEIFGIILIIIGTVVVGYFGNKGEKIFSFNKYFLIIYTLALIAICLLLIIYSVLNNYKFAGVIFGLFSGILGGTGLIFQKIVASIPPGFNLSDFSSIVICFKSIYFLIWVIFSLSSFVVIQIAYQHGKAVTIVPSYNSAAIIIPILGALFIFSEKVLIIQWIAIFLLIAGVLILSIYGEKSNQSLS
jgi:drug/metabolite transporter (DMT)-like permease